LRTYIVQFLQPSAQGLHDFRTAVREFVRPDLAAEVAEDLLLALDETVTNAIRHGACRPAISVHVSLEQEKVTATVQDGGAGFDIARLVETWPPRPEAESGRGVYLLTQLMDSVSIFAAGGTIVHMARGLREEHERRAPACVWTSPFQARFSSVGGPFGKAA
jgi:anti-sigma regulatory factor (Ser/Thr protein kinase)